MTAADATTPWSWPIEAARLAAATGQMMLDSAAAVGVRAPMIATALNDPIRADVPELARMVGEKVAAVSSAGAVLATAASSAGAVAAADARDLLTVGTAGRSPAAIWWRIAERNLAFVAAATTLPGRALAPVQGRVAGNRRRLT